MRILTNTIDFELDQKTAVAIGKFDGIHVGHQKLLQEILFKKKEGGLACVVTFDPAPAVLFGLSDGKELTTKEEKRVLFEKMGIDVLIEFPMTKITAAMEAEKFVSQMLVKQMKAKFVAAGSDLSFGAKGAGNSALLQQMGKVFDFEVKVIDKVCILDREVSSTYVREQVEKGNMEQVDRLLGMAYPVIGTVVKGNQIGRTIGFPTVNLQPKEGKLLPPRGVYFSSVFVDGIRYEAISNVGCKPTVMKKSAMGVESFLYDFEGDLYDHEIMVCLEEFKRPEQKFESLDALKAQLQEDILAGKMRLKKEQK